MSSRRQNDADGITDVFSYFCSLAVSKCAKKSERKKASCGGPAMRKRLLIKNFVTQMLDQERQMSQTGREQLSREVNIPSRRFHQSPLTQTRIDDEDDEMQDEELSTEDEYQSTDVNTENASLPEYDDDSASLDAEEVSDDEELDDSLNNNSKNLDDSSKLPAISTLDHQHRPFSPYLTVDAALEICEHDSSDLNDDLVRETFELFPSKSAVITSTNSVEVLKQAAPPSWHQSDPDLYILERSIPSLYYDDYTSGISYRSDDFTALHTTTTLASSDSYSSSFMISSAGSQDNHIQIANNRHPLPQLPENFMDESVITSTNLATNSYVELHTTNARNIIKMSSATKAFPYPNSFNDDEELDTKAEIELCSVEDKAQENTVDNEDVENEDSESSDDEDAPQTIVKSAFVDLINMVPQSMKLQMTGDCRTEALHDTCFGQRQITDLDTQLTLIEEDEFSEDHQLTPHHQLMMSDTKLSAAILDYDSPSLSELIGSDAYAPQNQKTRSSTVFAGKSPRKRLNQLDYGVMMAMSPKRIKL